MLIRSNDTAYEMYICDWSSDVCSSDLAGKSACNVEDLGLIPGLGESPEEGKAYPLQYSGLEKSMNYIVHRVTKSWK